MERGGAQERYRTLGFELLQNPAQVPTYEQITSSGVQLSASMPM